MSDEIGADKCFTEIYSKLQLTPVLSVPIEHLPENKETAGKMIHFR
jgi:hypothetical protein